MPSKKTPAKKPVVDKSVDEVKTPRRCKQCGHTLAERNPNDVCFRHHPTMSHIKGSFNPPFSSGSQGERTTAMDRQYHGQSES